MISPKTKDILFKILNIYPSNESWRQRFNIDHNNCNFCEMKYYKTTQKYLGRCYIFGITLKDKRYDMVLNNLLLLATFFIIMSKWS